MSVTHQLISRFETGEHWVLVFMHSILDQQLHTLCVQTISMKFLRPLPLFLLLLWMPALSVAAAYSPTGEARIALVIGNANYQSGALLNPLNDARSVSGSLEKLGFKVMLRENLSREGMYQSISEFGKLLKENGVGLFYYAGHGMQIRGKNYLIPVDANILNEDEVEFRGLDANFVLSRMEAARNRVNLLVLDACRNNPFLRNARSASIGLAQMDAPKGTLIAFSTAPGALAKDGAGKNSVYTRHLLEKLFLPAAPIEQVFKEVRIAVAKETNDKQIPWESSSLMGDFYFAPPSSMAQPTTAQAVPSDIKEPAIPVVSPKTEVEPPPLAKAPKFEKYRPAKPEQIERDYNREGSEIGLRAMNLTADELPMLQASAEQGDSIAQTTLGWAYLLGNGELDGRGIPRNNSKMLKWTLAAVKQGYPVAQNNLGVFYRRGIGVKTDYQKAQHYFKLSADQGYLLAKSNLLMINMQITGKIDSHMAGQVFKDFQQQILQPAH